MTDFQEREGIKSQVLDEAHLLAGAGKFDRRRGGW